MHLTHLKKNSRAYARFVACLIHDLHVTSSTLATVLCYATRTTILALCYKSNILRNATPPIRPGTHQVRAGRVMKWVGVRAAGGSCCWQMDPMAWVSADGLFRVRFPGCCFIIWVMILCLRKGTHCLRMVARFEIATSVVAVPVKAHLALLFAGMLSKLSHFLCFFETVCGVLSV